MKHVGCFLSTFILFWAVAMTVISVNMFYPVYADVDAMLERVQVSADMAKMATRLGTLISNMEKHGITHGHASILFKNPQNDVGLDYEALKDLQERALKVAELPEDSVEYQTALDDMRGTLREIDIGAVTYAEIHSPVFWLTTAMWFLAVIGGLLALLASDLDFLV